MEILTLVAVLLATALVFLLAQRIGSRQPEGKPVPFLPVPTTFFFGHLPWLVGEHSKAGGLRFVPYFRSFLKYRFPLFRLRLGLPFKIGPFGGKSMIVVCDSSVVEEMVKSKAFGVNSMIAANFAYIVGDKALVSLHGHQWKRHRRLMQPIFRKQYVESALEVICRHTRKTLDELGSLSDRKPVDAVEVLNRLTMDITAEVSYAYDLRQQTEEKQKAIRDALLAVFRRFSSVAVQPSIALVKLLDWKAHAEFLQQREFVKKELIYPMVEKRRQEFSRGEGMPHDLLSLLLRAQDEEGGTGDRFTEEEVIDEALVMFIAGYETTSSTVAWLFYYLAQYPDVQKRLYEEVINGINPEDSSFSLDEINKLTYLSQVIKEVQRLNPAVELFGRGTLSDAVVQGYHIPAGSPVYISTYTIHRSPEEWDEPEVFKPERWEKPDGGCKKSAGFSFLAFGAGQHRCIGQPLALPEVKLVTALWVSKFRMTLASDDIKPSMGVLYFPGQVMLNLYRR